MKSDAPKMPKQGEAKRDGVINSQFQSILKTENLDALHQQWHSIKS